MSESNPIHQLPDGDAVFLSTETDVAWGHMGGLSILDPAGVPEFGYEHMLEHIGRRLELVPRFTWKLQEVPLGLDRPYWVEDPDFDLRNHIHRVAVPAPGGMPELGELCGHLFSHALDRSRPLWEIWVIEGIEKGTKVGMFMKTHHCLMDGQAGAGLAEVLTDLAPDATAPPIVPDAMAEEAPRPPSLFEVTARGLRNALERPVKATGHVTTALRTFGRRAFSGDDEHAPPAWSDVPKLSFNEAVSRRRNFAAATLELDDLLDIKKHFDVKLNDVVLEIIGGAMRRWLREKGELPEQPIVALCPVSLREAGDASLCNQITNMTVALASDLDDPAERLMHIARNADRAKQGVEEGSFDVLAALSESLAPGVLSAVLQAGSTSADSAPLPGNFVVSNVRGTPVPLYTAGARIESMFPMSLLQTGQGLNATVVSYMGKMQFSFTVDPDLVPDVHELKNHIYGAFEALQSAMDGVVHRSR
ncbi:MAG: WS/DGAT/MGAT family O-acyltransferase [Myxococcota bacterium]